MRPMDSTLPGWHCVTSEESEIRKGEKGRKRDGIFSCPGSVVVQTHPKRNPHHTAQSEVGSCSSEPAVSPEEEPLCPVGPFAQKSPLGAFGSPFHLCLCRKAGHWLPLTVSQGHWERERTWTKEQGCFRPGITPSAARRSL